MKFEHKSKPITIFIFVISIFLITAGILFGEAEFLIEKVTRICMECIGIG